MGIFLMPFALLLKFFYDFFQSYGIALILFALIIKLVLFPFSLKGKRSMIQMNLLSGKMQQLQKQYGKDRERYNLEVQKLYEKEKVNPMSGCLWSFIPILFLMVLYGIIREPLTYFMGLTMEQIQLIAQELDWQTVAVSSGWVTPAAMEKLVQQVADGKLTSVFQNGAYNQTVPSAVPPRPGPVQGSGLLRPLPAPAGRLDRPTAPKPDSHRRLPAQPQTHGSVPERPVQWTRHCPDGSAAVPVWRSDLHFRL